MPTYVMLANWTDQGVRTIDDGPKRVDVARKSLEDMGGKFLSVYMTMGIHDMVITYDAPDDAVAARFTLLLGRQGNVRTQSLKAFPEEAYRQIVNSLRWAAACDSPMRAAVFHGPGERLSIEDRQMPTARPGDVVLRVAYCGICGSDLHA